MIFLQENVFLQYTMNNEIWPFGWVVCFYTKTKRKFFQLLMVAVFSCTLRAESFHRRRDVIKAATGDGEISGVWSRVTMFKTDWSADALRKAVTGGLWIHSLWGKQKWVTIPKLCHQHLNISDVQLDQGIKVKKEKTLFFLKDNDPPWIFTKMQHYKDKGLTLSSLEARKVEVGNSGGQPWGRKGAGNNFLFYGPAISAYLLHPKPQKDPSWQEYN